MTQAKTRYVVFARPIDQLLVEDFQKIASFTTMELANFLKINNEEEFLAIHTPYYLKTLGDSSHPFEEYKNVIRDSKPESKYLRPDYYIAILPKNEYNENDFTIYVDVEILNPRKDQEEDKELTIPPFPNSFRIEEVTSYSDLKQVIMKNFPFAVKIGETPKISINIPKDAGNDTDVYEFDLSDENTGNYPRPDISNFFDSYLNKNRIKVSCIIEDKALTKIRHRVSIIKEIKTTEQTFINGLHYLIDYYQDKFKANKMLSFEEDQKVFKNIPLIIAAHEALLKLLDVAGQTYASNLSPVFIDFSNYFKVSKLYISQYSAIIQMFLEKKKDKEFARKFQEISKGHTELNSFLITPVQRMPRYILFLRELIKFTPPSHPDSSLLKTAEKLLQDVTFDIEKASTEAENQALTSTIQDKIGKDQIIIIKPDRVCLLTMKINFIKPKLGPGTIYMFNDLVLIITEKSVSDIDSNCQIILAQTPIEFKYSIPSIDQMTFIIDGTPISQAVIQGIPMTASLSAQYDADDDSSENLDKKGKGDKKSKREKKEEEKRGKERKKEEEKREREKKKQRLAIVEFDVREEKEQFMEELYKAKSKYFSKAIDKKNIFRFVPLNLKSMNESTLFLSDADGAYIPEQQLLYIFGGNPLNNNLLIINVFNGSVMSRPTKIPPRMNHTVSYYTKPGAEDGNDKFLLIFGGRGEGNEAYNDLWEINLKNYEDTREITTKLTPEPRYGHSAVVCNNRLYIFGGMNKKKVFNDLCSIGIYEENKIWQTNQATEMFPSPRAFHSSALVDNKWYIFGGINDKKASVFTTKPPEEPDTLHCLDFSNFFWESYDLPFVQNRAWHRIVAVGTYIILLGGTRELDFEPIVSYDTLYKTARSHRAAFNEPSFLTCFYSTFVNPFATNAKNSLASIAIDPKIEGGNEIRRTSQPHLLVFGGINPITRELSCGLYEVKIPSFILDRLKSDGQMAAPQPKARKKEHSKKRMPDSIPIGSNKLIQGFEENANDDSRILEMKRAVSAISATSNSTKDFTDAYRKSNLEETTSTNSTSESQTEMKIMESQIDSSSTSFAESAEKTNVPLESQEPKNDKPPVPPKAASGIAAKLALFSNAGEQPSFNVKNIPAPSPPQAQAQAKAQEPPPSPPKAAPSGFAARLAMFNGSGPIGAGAAASSTPAPKPTPTSAPTPKPAPAPAAVAAPKPAAVAAPKPAPAPATKPTPTSAPAFAVTLKPIPKQSPSPSTSDSNPFNSSSKQAQPAIISPQSSNANNPFNKSAPAHPPSQPAAPASAPTQEASGDFDEIGFCNSIGVDPTKLLNYQRIALVNKLKVLHSLKVENQEMEVKIAKTTPGNKPSNNQQTASQVFGKVIVKKKFVKVVMINTDSNLTQVRSQIKAECADSVADSLRMFVTDKPLSSIPPTSIKETTPNELKTILHSKNSSHVNFCFQ